MTDDTPLTPQQLMDGADLLDKCARQRQEHAQFSRVPFDKLMLIQAAANLSERAEQLSQWAGAISSPDASDYAKASYYPWIDRQAKLYLAQMEPVGDEVAPATAEAV